MGMNTAFVDIPLVLFWVSMTVTVAVCGAVVWTSLKPRPREKKR
jgi:hypothetical protein